MSIRDFLEERHLFVHSWAYYGRRYYPVPLVIDDATNRRVIVEVRKNCIVKGCKIDRLVEYRWENARR